MRYVCLCYASEQQLQAMPKHEWDVVVREVYTYNETLRSQGHLVMAQALQSVQTATTVRVRSNKLHITDGPFTETKEQLGGFFLIDAKDLNEAIQIAAKLPGARLGCIEIRPVTDLQ